MILGIDEVGRGAWAGPLVVGAAVLPDGCEIEGLTDSKKLTAKRRKLLEAEIKQKASGWGLGWVHPRELDELGLSDALRVATRRAVSRVEAPYSQIIIDGTINFISGTGKGAYVTTLKKADLLIPSVSAAAILAKVARDEYMAAQDELYGGYGFAGHVGYGTAAHSKALDEKGVSPLHRASFKPIAVHLSFSRNAGKEGEDRGVAYLREQGYVIVERNWRTRWCEIDIIAEKAGVLYFVEVKYRKDASFGGAEAALSRKKLEQMRFAAELYLSGYHAHTPARIAAIAINGADAPSYLIFE